jgi:hypothetical protein
MLALASDQSVAARPNCQFAEECNQPVLVCEMTDPDTAHASPGSGRTLSLEAGNWRCRVGDVGQKSRKIQQLVAEYEGGDLSPYYLGYFACFNRQLYFEAHEVLEGLWLPQRQGADGAFYKGLIQLAGAFVHLQKGRPRPAEALFKLARENLRKYPPIHQQLDIASVLALIEDWRHRGAASEAGGLKPGMGDGPKLGLAG